jgi:hypothetical protein
MKGKSNTFLEVVNNNNYIFLSADFCRPYSLPGFERLLLAQRDGLGSVPNFRKTIYHYQVSLHTMLAILEHFKDSLHI